MPLRVDLSVHEISVPVVVRNAPPARLYEDAVTREHAAIMINTSYGHRHRRRMSGGDRSTIPSTTTPSC